MEERVRASWLRSRCHVMKGKKTRRSYRLHRRRCQEAATMIAVLLRTVRWEAAGPDKGHELRVPLASSTCQSVWSLLETLDATQHASKYVNRRKRNKAHRQFDVIKSMYLLMYASLRKKCHEGHSKCTLNPTCTGRQGRRKAVITQLSSVGGFRLPSSLAPCHCC